MQMSDGKRPLSNELHQEIVLTWFKTLVLRPGFSAGSGTLV